MTIMLPTDITIPARTIRVLKFEYPAGETPRVGTLDGHATCLKVETFEVPTLDDAQTSLGNYLFDRLIDLALAAGTRDLTLVMGVPDSNQHVVGIQGVDGILGYRVTVATMGTRGPVTPFNNAQMNEIMVDAKKVRAAKENPDG